MNSLLAALFASTLVFIQCYISGTRLAFSLPAYTLLGVAAVVSIFSRRERQGLPSRWCVATTALLFAYILARVWWSPVEYLARSDYYLSLACLAVYALTVLYITERTQRMAILWILFGLAAVEVVIGTRQFMYGDNWMPFGLLRAGVPTATRASGTFNSSIHLAGYLEAVAPFALALAFWGYRKMWARLLAGYVAVVCYFGVGITGSRGGWLSSAFSLLVFAVLSLILIWRHNRKRFPGALYLSLVGVLALPAGALALLQRDAMLTEQVKTLSKAPIQKEDFYDIRVHNWAAALDQWREAQWLGTGAGTHLYYGRKYRRPELQSDPEHAHSDYLELLAEYGLIGAAGVVLLLLAHAGSGWRGFRELAIRRAEDPYRSSLELALNMGALSAFSAYLLHSAIDFNLHLPGNALLFAFIFGILAHPAPPPPAAELTTADPDEPSTPTKSWPLWARLIPPALGAWILIAATPKWRAEALGEQARVAERAGHHDEAIALAETALQREQRNPYLYYYLGQAHRQRGLWAPQVVREAGLAAAEQAYRAGLSLYPQDETLWVRLAVTLDEQGKYQEARAAYEEAIRLDPNLGVLYVYLSEHFRKIGNTAKAQALLAQGQALANEDLSGRFREDLYAPDAPEERPK